MSWDSFNDGENAAKSASAAPVTVSKNNPKYLFLKNDNILVISP
jgi:hypothetical protein